MDALRLYSSNTADLFLVSIMICGYLLMIVAGSVYQLYAESVMVIENFHHLVDTVDNNII